MKTAGKRSYRMGFWQLLAQLRLGRLPEMTAQIRNWYCGPPQFLHTAAGDGHSSRDLSPVGSARFTFVNNVVGDFWASIFKRRFPRKHCTIRIHFVDFNRCWRTWFIWKDKKEKLSLFPNIWNRDEQSGGLETRAAVFILLLTSHDLASYFSPDLTLSYLKLSIWNTWSLMVFFSCKTRLFCVENNSWWQRYIKLGIFAHMLFCKFYDITLTKVKPESLVKCFSYLILWAW